MTGAQSERLSEVPTYRTVIRRLRPSRVATLLPDESSWHGAALALMRSYSRTWGGLADVIVPYGPDGAVHDAIWKTLRAFDADHFAGDRPLREPTALTDRIVEHLSPFTYNSTVVRQHFYPDSAPPASVTDMCKLTYVPPQVSQLDTSAFPAALQVLIASRTGGLMPEHEDALGAAGTQIDTVIVTPELLPMTLRLAWTGVADSAWWMSARAARPLTGDAELAEQAPLTQEVASRTPFALSKYGCQWFTNVAVPWDLPITFVVGDSLQDFSLALLRDRLGLLTLWVPSTAVEDEGPVGDAFLSALGRTIDELSATAAGPRQVLATSLSLDEAQIGAVTDSLKRRQPFAHHTVITYQSPTDLTSVRRQFLLDRLCYGTESRQPFLGPELVGEIPPLTPTDALGHDTEDCKWQLDVLVPGGRGETGHQLPPRSPLHEIVDREPNPPAEVRVASEGTSYCSHTMGFVLNGTPLQQRLAKPQLRLPGAEEIFHTLAARLGHTLTESPAGRYNRLAVELWGGLGPLVDDLQGIGTRALLDAWRSQAASG